MEVDRLDVCWTSESFLQLVHCTRRGINAKVRTNFRKTVGVSRYDCAASGLLVIIQIPDVSDCCSVRVQDDQLDAGIKTNSEVEEHLSVGEVGSF